MKINLILMNLYILLIYLVNLLDVGNVYSKQMVVQILPIERS